MTTYLDITNGLKRSLGYIDEDDSLDEASLNRMKNGLTAAELYVQGAIGTDVKDFYESKDIKPLYTLVCNALAATYYQSPTSTTSGAVVSVDAVCKSVIGQLRGRYDRLLEVQNGKDSESKQAD
ncbi:head-tail connector protein [Lactobacillus hominis]|uniref:DNA packaging protein n=1 Tax=Lactobacillus hominis DSM 23910 = CRBIP 24.179 TaxID=1423758 RepID=I7JV69_9LACO|nr:head-tail connector protein [Lactobacillus hominis]KRM84388.1 phage QLRG family, putative DNA packaging [Lactobacillus hominis DSM 23910 = CRBIP 24.179]MCT3347723.1 DNA packaging protein [Lactobacillus hominis]CCI82316.1 Putative uncharacterized protein [Lactobacillus hominis DSM 23910 = CRBIP 24.179]